MAIHENLLRLHRWQLDERRRYAAELEALSERLRADLRLLEAAIALEGGTLGRLSESQAEGPAGTARLRGRQRKLEHSVAELERQIAAARAAVAATENKNAAYELASAHRKLLGRAVLPRLS